MQRNGELIMFSKFAKGDRIVAVNKSPWYDKGDKGTFVRKSAPFPFSIKSQLPYLVKFDDGRKIWCYEADIEQITYAESDDTKTLV